MISTRNAKSSKNSNERSVPYLIVETDGDETVGSKRETVVLRRETVALQSDINMSSAVSAEERNQRSSRATEFTEDETAAAAGRESPDDRCAKRGGINDSHDVEHDSVVIQQSRSSSGSGVVAADTELRQIRRRKKMVPASGD